MSQRGRTASQGKERRKSGHRCVFEGHLGKRWLDDGSLRGAGLARQRHRTGCQGSPKCSILSEDLCQRGWDETRLWSSIRRSEMWDMVFEYKCRDFFSSRIKLFLFKIEKCFFFSSNYLWCSREERKKIRLQKIKWLHRLHNISSISNCKLTDKNILNRALEDSGFWQGNSALKQREKVVWLLLYDMQGRKFARRRDGNALETRNRIFKVYCIYLAIICSPFIIEDPVCSDIKIDDFWRILEIFLPFYFIIFLLILKQDQVLF